VPDDLVLVESSAVLSDCRRYRYELRRRFADGPTVLFIGLNPSTADEHADDPTIRRCLAFAKRWGYGQLVMANLYAWRCTDPRHLASAAEDPVGEMVEVERGHWLNRNDVVLHRLAREADLRIAAWGAHLGPYVHRSAEAMDLVGGLHVLGLTKGLAPRHPLYMPAATDPVRWTHA
jgi:hypothetical protein